MIWLIILSGLGGEPRYTAAFEEHARALMQIAQTRLAIPPERILHRSELTTPSISRETVAGVLDAVAAEAAPDATIVIVMLGHGSAVGGTPRWHLPGPDLTPDDLARALVAFPTQEVVVVNAASASGPWAEALAGPRRTVITATRSAAQRDETVFPRYFVEALGADGVDADRNGRISVLEAFRFARREVVRHYEEARRLPTEYALLEDDGDGRGTAEPDPATGGDGARAAVLYLGGSPAVADTALAALVARRDSLERAVAALRARRAAFPPEEYDRRLEALLIELARVGREIRAREEGTEP